MKKRIQLVCALLCLVLLLSACGAPAVGSKTPSAAMPKADLNIWIPQIGKADAILIWTKDNCVLIDAGEKGDAKMVLAKMEELSLPKIDVMIITHFDKDHVGGAAKILRSVPVDRVLQNNYPEDDYENQQYREALEKMGIQPETLTSDLRFSLGEMKFTVKAARQDSYKKDESNNFSLITEMVYGEKRFTFLGDAGSERLKEYDQTAPQACDFVKMPHHGSWYKPLKNLMLSLKPQYAVITCSASMPEDAQTAELLKSCQTEMYLTRSGDIQVASDGKTIAVTQTPAP